MLARFLVTMPSSEPTNTGTTYVLMFRRCAISLLISWYLWIFSLSLSAMLGSPGTAMSITMHSFSFLFTSTMSGLSSWISRSPSVLMVKSHRDHRSFMVAFSIIGSGLCSYYFFAESSPYCFTIDQCTILATLSCLCCIHTASDPLSRLSNRTLHKGDSCCFSIFALITLVLKG